MKSYLKLLTPLEMDLEQLEFGASRNYESAQKGIQLCRDTLCTIRDRVLKKGFNNVKEESLFFKTIKPKLVGYLIFYINIIDIELNRPPVSGKEKQKYYADYISLLRTYFLEHREIYQYYSSGQSHLDIEYFTRSAHSTSFYHDSLTSLIDIQFSTAKDMIFAQIIGNTLTINYLKQKISRKNGSSNIESRKISSLKWTCAKVDLVELIYALHASNSLNHGRADIKEIFTAFESIIHIQLGDYYRTFLEIRSRKNQSTKFLDFLKLNLVSRMEDNDR